MCERLQSGQQRHFGSTVEALIIRMFTMTGRRRKRERERERERERKRAGHCKFHLSDHLLMIEVYFSDATPFSLTRYFDGRQSPGTRPKNSLISLCVILSNLWIFNGILLGCKKSVFLFLYLKRHVWFQYLNNLWVTRKITLIAWISFYSTESIGLAKSQRLVISIHFLKHFKWLWRRIPQLDQKFKVKSNKWFN